MNECEYAGRLSAFHDSELSAADRAVVQHHLQECPLCRADLASIEKLSLKIASMPLPALPAAAIDRLHRNFRRAPSAGVLHLAEALMAVAAMVLITCVIALASIGTHQPAGLTMAAADTSAWESQAVAADSPEPAQASSEEALAAWIVQDLSAAGDHQ